jgi:hypothetical protein
MTMRTKQPSPTTESIAVLLYMLDPPSVKGSGQGVKRILRGLPHGESPHLDRYKVMHEGQALMWSELAVQFVSRFQPSS